MKVLVISDTHKRLANLEKLLGQIEPFDMLLHCGDMEGDEIRIESMVNCPVYFVSGNCDFNGENPFDRIVELEGHRIFMSHGHRFSVGATLDYLVENALIRGADVALYGHLHRPDLTEYAGVTIASPGSLSEPRQDNRRPSYIIMDVIKDKPVKVNINYL